MFNFLERIKKINFSSFRDSSESSIELGNTESDIKNIKLGLYKEKDSPEYKGSLNRAISSHNTLSELAKDDEFLKYFKEKHANDGEYEKLIDWMDKSSKISDSIKKNQKLMVEKSADRLKMGQKLGDAITSGMEEPAKSFYQGIFNMLIEHEMDATKIKLLKDDETGFDISKELDKDSGKDKLVDSAAEVTNVEILPDETANKLLLDYKENPSKFDNPEVIDAEYTMEVPKVENNKLRLEYKPSDDNKENENKPNPPNGPLMIEDKSKPDINKIKDELMKNWDSNKWSNGSIESKKELVKDKKFDEFLRKEHKKAWTAIHKEIGDIDKLNDESSKKNFCERIRKSFSNASMIDAMEAGRRIPDSQIVAPKDPKKLIQLILLADAMQKSRKFLTPQEIAKKVGVTPGEAEWVARNYDEAEDLVSGELNKLIH